MKAKILVFSGNSETDKLVLKLAGSGVKCIVSVASETGEKALQCKLEGDTEIASKPEIRVCRMDDGEMREFILKEAFDCVVDGTHPFAEEASKNIEKAVVTYPDVYEYALKKLSITPSEVIVFEDSPNGLKAAHGAHCFTIMVKDLTPYEKGMTYVDAYIENLKSLL